MLIRHKDKALLGLSLAISFLVLLALVFAPIFQGMNGLEFSEQLFNRLAKGSSYFVPTLSSDLKSAENQEVAVSVKLESAEQATKAQRILARAVPDTTAHGAVLNVKGDLAKLLGAAIEDCRAMYLNHDDELKVKYGMTGKDVMLTWYSTLNGAADALQRGKSKNIAQSKLILSVVTKGIEPAYNFYGIEPESVGHRAGITTLLLVFYLVYTLWWGLAIYFLFEGFGLAMTKARVKREV